jgi:DNA polymerase-3 subunit gamma/tau
MSNPPLITKYRPADFSDMIGHREIVRSLERAIAGSAAPHCFLLTGPGGTGKTTTARILASRLGAEIIETSGAEKSGTDDMRQIVELGSHMSLSGSGKRMIIIDECHALSKSAWQVLLKLLEEPPEWLYVSLCTTEAGKVPDTIMQRCYPVAFRSLSPVDIQTMLDIIIDIEEWTVVPDVFSLIVEEARGSMRKAITYLQAVWDAPSREEASRIISLQESSEPVSDLAKYLVKGGPYKWDIIQPILARIPDEDWDGAYIQIGRYIAGAMMNSKKQEAATKQWELLEALTFPVNTVDRKVAFYTALGKIVFLK